MTAPGRPWWRDAVVYQIYVRSFADGDGDGTGDIAGVRSRLPYLAALGVDALWINPWYPSPMADSGYDVADYRDVEPVFGDLAQAQELIDEAHAHGLRVILDVVPNHSSDRHALFQAALAAAPGAPERGLYVFRDGRGPGGDERPNDWRSMFGGPAWTRVPDGQWYLHLFAPAQPDFDWEHPAVAEEFDATLRFWFDRGVDGFRIDVAHGLAKADGLPDAGERPWPEPPGAPSHPHWDVDAVHDVWRRWRRVADEYDGDRTFVAEAWVSDPDRLARYVRPDELHTAFNFDFLMCPWRADDLRAVIDATLAAQSAVGAPSTWVLANHDVIREVSRYARPQEHGYPADPTALAGLPCDLDLGRRRARAAALLMLALPGGAYVYQGQELGLPEVEELPAAARQDPTFHQTGGERLGRDGCRVPIPWSGATAPFGFSPADATGDPWLPMPDAFAGRTAADQAGVPASMLELYRAALRIRREHPALGDGTLRWRAAPRLAGDAARAVATDGSPAGAQDDAASAAAPERPEAGVLHFERDPGFACLVNLGAEAVALPRHAELLLASTSLEAGRLPSDAAVWLRRA